MSTDNSIDTTDQTSLPNLFLELHRLDIEFWGTVRTAQVVRCLAALFFPDGTPAKLNKIANILDCGVATVHAHLGKLQEWSVGPDGRRVALVARVEGGYRFTPEGEAILERWQHEAERLIRRSHAFDLVAAAKQRQAAGQGSTSGPNAVSRRARPLSTNSNVHLPKADFYRTADFSNR